MVGWHHQFNRHEFEQVLAVGDGQGSLACCGPWVAESDTTKRLNCTDGPGMVIHTLKVKFHLNRINLSIRFYFQAYFKDKEMTIWRV